MTERKITVGRIVHYLNTGNGPRAALVVKGGTLGVASLVVFNEDGTSFFRKQVEQAPEDGAGLGMHEWWVFPPRV